MSEAKKHTPGPWFWLSDNYLESEAKDGGTVLEASDDGAPWGMHSSLIRHHWDEEVAAANKRLIAAAPALYEALKRLAKLIPVAANCQEGGNVVDYTDEEWAELCAVTPLVYEALKAAEGSQQ